MHRSLGRLVHEAARLDFFVGLQLNWLGPYLQVDVSKYLTPTRHTLDNRLAILRKLVRKAYRSARPEVIAEFDQRFARARSARALRNNYAHGRWGVSGKPAESPLGPHHPRIPVLAFVRLDWDMTPNQPDKSFFMTVDELRDQVTEAVTVFKAFFDLPEKHKHHCLPQWHAKR
ncbi:hypothetical protein [Pelomonas cellulosilytica]|uniref:HEPN AbiU2-like domain-containing protein n=1 Tax=Pelomonas cellulosilytica TaxID=2906762 RepID=A0ABS8XQL9_9BURK|nr:hypothetical protein [Pelomonas sp. P8]MCE4555032.1 hypothetical protein [Pelomonas sp. P8]